MRVEIYLSILLHPCDTWMSNHRLLNNTATTINNSVATGFLVTVVQELVDSEMQKHGKQNMRIQIKVKVQWKKKVQEVA